jgi:hypothetical protein
MPSSRQCTLDDDFSFGISPPKHNFLNYKREKDGIVSVKS